MENRVRVEGYLRNIADKDNKLVLTIEVEKPQRSIDVVQEDLNRERKDITTNMAKLKRGKSKLVKLIKAKMDRELISEARGDIRDIQDEIQSSQEIIKGYEEELEELKNNNLAKLHVGHIIIEKEI